MREQTILRRFGARVRDLRKRCDWTQEDLAEAANLHENYISRLETGNQEPGLFVILRLSAVLGVKPADLLNIAC